MGDFVVLQNDLVMFQPTLGAATVVVRPGTMLGSGPATTARRPICVEGDETNVVVAGCTYISGAHSIPGVGTLKIDRLGSDQTTTKTKHGGKALILVGATFTSKFEVQAPAMRPQPPGPPVPDPTPSYSGQGSFVTSNVTFKAT